MIKKWLALNTLALVFFLGCAEEKKKPAPSQKAEPVQTQPRVSGASQPIETSISGLRQAQEGKTHVSGN